LIFCNTNKAELVLDLAAADEGVAFRYRFSGHSGAFRTITTERTGFAVWPSARAWLQPYHAASAYTPAYEDFYFQTAPGTPPPKSRAKPLGWSFPALFHTPGADAWMLLTESGTDETYCACHLGPDSSGGLYRMAFPDEQEATKGQKYQTGTEPRFTLPWTLPWRVIVLGKSAGDIALSTLVTDLAPPSKIEDTSWIRPGRASWSWWAYPDGPNTASLFNKFTDLAADMGWEYTLFDAGWWDVGLRPLADYARRRGVAPLAWTSASDFYTPGRTNRKLDEMAAAGVAGVKVDFWCSDRQEAMAAMHTLFEAAANRRLLVNLHGCTLPRGWHRTWPNLLTAEAVLGTESYMFEPQFTEGAAELNTVLPFTRNVGGPMDATPAGFSPKKYPRTTTAAHELAAALIFNSGLIHYADQPDFFQSLPGPVKQVLRDAPARWDETRCLAGEPGRVAVFARRTGRTWFVCGINGTTNTLPVDLDLAAYKRFPRRLLIHEAPAALMQVAAEPISAVNRWQHPIPPRGGFVLRLDRR
ncbi:MAG TPA: glycoside hydrolase family 97 catalytic domain-containing protein, partial [Clostridia bacterium]|nr:glycoside hydrolase family 97 catalytic domain-containing protein [Clostridia bacterium]